MTTRPVGLKFSIIEQLESRTLFSGVELSGYLSSQVDRTPTVLRPVALPSAVSASPQLPQVLLDTTYAPGSGNTINVPAGGNVQTALNNAQPGDTILLAAGATFTGNFTLPNKTGSGWITIRTSAADSQLPRQGERIAPSHFAKMPKLVSPNGAPALATQNNAHHYRFIGVEFTVASNVATNTGIISLGSSTQTSAQTPHHLIFDRVYIHGKSNQQIQNGMRLNSASTAIIDSRFENCQATSFESHCIAGYNGPGPFKIVNNYLSGATIPVLFGGAVPSVNGLVPSDIEFKNNHVTRPLSWKPGHPSYAGTPWYVKNLFEIKNGQRVLVEGNILEHNWPHTGSTPDGSPQHGYAILLTVRDENDNASWARVADVTLRKNVIRESNVGISLSGTEGQGTSRIKIENNLFDDIGLNWGNNDRSGMWIQSQSASDVIVDHNTVINDGDVLFANGNEVGDLDFTNNIVNHNASRPINAARGIHAPGTAVGTTSLNAKFVQFDVTKNVFVNAAGFTGNYPAGNFFPAGFSAVGFADFADGDYALTSSSAYNNAGSDGKDIGADIDALEKATAGAISGVWTTSAPATNGYQQNKKGRVSIEAEFNDGITSRGGKTWNAVSKPRYSSGSGLRALSNTGAVRNKNPETTSPQVDYNINFKRTGTHYVWVRGFANNSSDNSLHIGFNGELVGRNVTGFRKDGTWKKRVFGGDVVAIDVPFTGVHTLSLWMREDGLVVDRIVVTSSSSYKPGGRGPAMSKRTGVPAAKPTIKSLLATPVVVQKGQRITLTARGVADANGNLDEVRFYRDSNNNGIFDSSDLRIGTDTSRTNRWRTSFFTGGLSVATHRFFARARDSRGAFSSAVTITVNVTAPSALPFEKVFPSPFASQLPHRIELPL